MKNHVEGRVTKTTPEEIVCDLAYLESIGAQAMVDLSEVVFHKDHNSVKGLEKFFETLKDSSADQSLRLILLRS